MVNNALSIVSGVSQTDRQTDRQAGRQTDRKADRQTDRQTAGLNNGVAALKRENKKIEKYNGERHIGGNSSELVPLVCEHFGYWGKDSVRFLNRISLRSRDDDGKINSAEFKTYWRHVLSVTLQRCKCH